MGIISGDINFQGGGTQDELLSQNGSPGSKSESTEISQVDIKSRNKSGLKPPWKKGQSGNPKGRPKKAQSITAQLELEANRVVTVTLGGVKYRGRNMEILAKRMFERAIRKVEPRLCEAIIDRIDGKAVSVLELAGKGGKPVEIVVLNDGNDREN